VVSASDQSLVLAAIPVLFDLHEAADNRHREAPYQVREEHKCVVEYADDCQIARWDSGAYFRSKGLDSTLYVLFGPYYPNVLVHIVPRRRCPATPVSHRWRSG